MNQRPTLPIVHSAMPPASRVAFGLANLLLRWETRHRLRRDLSRLDGHLLADIGVLPHLAAAECGKPFWRP